MSDYSSSDIVDFSIDNDVNKVQAAVNELMKGKVADFLVAKKIEVGKAFFNKEE